MMGGTFQNDLAEVDGLLDGRCILFSIHSSLDSCLSSLLTTLLRVLLQGGNNFRTVHHYKREMVCPMLAGDSL